MALHWDLKKKLGFFIILYINNKLQRLINFQVNHSINVSETDVKMLWIWNISTTQDISCSISQFMNNCCLFIYFVHSPWYQFKQKDLFMWIIFSNVWTRFHVNGKLQVKLIHPHPSTPPPPTRINYTHIYVCVISTSLLACIVLIELSIETPI